LKPLPDDSPKIAMFEYVELLAKDPIPINGCVVGEFPVDTNWVEYVSPKYKAGFREAGIPTIF
jgi:hypothetical protein